MCNLRRSPRAAKCKPVSSSYSRRPLARNKIIRFASAKPHTLRH
ncbi:unnamed protein product, partial [Notodromas monacha]